MSIVNYQLSILRNVRQFQVFRAVFRDEVGAGKDHVGGGLAVASARIDIAADTAGTLLADKLAPFQQDLEKRWPRQCAAIQTCISRLSQLEKENCPNPDEPAACFGELMARILVYREDMWAKDLGQMGFSLGRFIYLLDAAVDYDRDKRKGKYNPYLAMGMDKDEKRWEEYLVLAMGRCTESYEKLPLVQDKALLDNILYSGVWVNYRGKSKKEDGHD